MRRPFRLLPLAAVAALASLAMGGRADGQVNLGIPEQAQGVGIDQRVGATLPLDLEFTDEQGQRVKVRDYFDGTKPAIVTLNYSRCVSLCSVQLDALVQSLAEIDLEPGKDYRVVTFSIDPDETPGRARATKDKYLALLGREGGEQGWSFLTGDQAAINDITAACGFRYRKDETSNEWVHSAALLMVTPDGRISHYVADVSYPPTTLRLSLLDAGRGTIGNVIDAFFLWCMGFDHVSGQYVMMATNIMKIGGAVTLLAIVALLWWLRSSSSSASTPVEVTR